MFSNNEKEIDLIVSNINQLQSIEQGLITRLSSASDPNAKNKLTSEINAIVQARITLYESLVLLYSSMEKNIEDSSSQLTKQVSLINEMEEQLNNNKLDIKSWLHDERRLKTPPCIIKD